MKCQLGEIYFWPSISLKHLTHFDGMQIQKRKIVKRARLIRLCRVVTYRVHTQRHSNAPDDLSLEQNVRPSTIKFLEIDLKIQTSSFSKLTFILLFLVFLLLSLDFPKF